MIMFIGPRHSSGAHGSPGATGVARSDEVGLSRGEGVPGIVDSWAKTFVPSASNRSTPTVDSWTLVGSTKSNFALGRRRIAGAFEHALGDLAFAQHDQVGAEPLEMGDRRVGMGARQDLEQRVDGARLLDHLAGLEGLGDGD